VAALLIAITIVVLTGLTGEPRRRGEPPRGRGADGVTEAGSALATAANG
jgi:hypothetical protein